MGPPAVEVAKKAKKKKPTAAGAATAGSGAEKRGAEAGAGAGKPKRPKTEPGAGAPAGQAWAMGADEKKGRIMVATRDLAVGEVILEEKALVVGSWHEHRCIECNEPHAPAQCEEVRAKYPAGIAAAMEEIESAVGAIDGIDELDIARRLIRALNIARREPDRIAQLTRPCTAHNMDKCRGIIAEIRAHKVARLILPKEVGDEEAARLLAVLNTNSHELGEWGGSGFFPLACLCEHSCQPNCAFCTSGTGLWITVVRPVSEGEALSIDYCDAAFEPTARRRKHLLEDYGFECLCAKCTTQVGAHRHPLPPPLSPLRRGLKSRGVADTEGGAQPDLARAFICPQEGCQGKVCPLGEPASPPPACWFCLAPSGVRFPSRRPLHSEQGWQTIGLEP
jgi:hypothetical protein